uniref:Uncharacterized protein n=1 Tax=Romanomermis culicivorax TaxID=13658 RepID=A0A915KQF7_ROMCU
MQYADYSPFSCPMRGLGYSPPFFMECGKIVDEIKVSSEPDLNGTGYFHVNDSHVGDSQLSEFPNQRHMANLERQLSL